MDDPNLVKSPNRFSSKVLSVRCRTFSSLSTRILSLADPPSAPEAPLVDEIFATTCRLQWSAPSSDGGSPLTHYILEKRLQGATRWSKVTKQTIGADTTQFVVDDLMEGSEYEFRVLACNKVGSSEPSAPSRTIVAKNPFGKFLFEGVRRRFSSVE